MSIKDLLVVLDADGKQGPAHAFAQSLAAKTGAHLTAVGVALQFVAPVSFAGDYPYDLLEEATEQSRKSLEAAYDKLRSSTPAGVETDLVMIEALSGVASAKLGELARHFDLTIVGQDDLGGIGDEAGLISAVLFGSGRPVFVVPYIHKGAGQDRPCRRRVGWRPRRLARARRRDAAAAEVQARRSGDDRARRTNPSRNCRASTSRATCRAMA